MKHAVTIVLALILQVNCVAACLIDCDEMIVSAASATPPCHKQSSSDQSNPSKPDHETAGCADGGQAVFETNKGPSIGLQHFAVLAPEVAILPVVATQSFGIFSVSEVAAPPVSSNLILRI